MKIQYVERRSRQIKEEAVYYEILLRLLYSSHIGRLLATWIAHTPLFSQLYGWWQTLRWTRRKILPFVEKYQIDLSDFEVPPGGFVSFDDFFTRRFKPAARPLAQADAVMPAEGRYLFYPNIATCDGFLVKGKKFNLAKLLRDEILAKKYEQGAMLIARLCPTDYHRFHFPCDCAAQSPQLINGALYSVNPIALLQNIDLLTENKRMRTELHTDLFGIVQYIEIGATNVGSIRQTFIPNKRYKKGDEKGFFSFGASALIILFEPNRILFDQELLNHSPQHLETLCRLSESLGTKI